MILNTGSRTDIPAFYSDWFYNRIQEGYCLVRNPYYPEQVTKYVISPQARSVTATQQELLIEAFSKIAAAKGMQIHLCCEDRALTRANVGADGCLSQAVLERAIGSALHVPKKKMARDACSCLLGADIGMYNTCGHGCLYCYANYDNESVRANRKLHDSASPLLIGHLHETDIIKEAEQKLWQDRQLSLFQIGL